MRAKIIKIGNSKGIRIPKPLLEQTGITADVDLSVDGDRIVLQAAHHPRDGWAAGIEAMRGENDGVHADDGANGRMPWDEQAWQW